MVEDMIRGSGLVEAGFVRKRLSFPAFSFALITFTTTTNDGTHPYVSVVQPPVL